MPTIEEIIAAASSKSQVVKNFADHVAQRTEKMREDLSNLSDDLKLVSEDTESSANESASDMSGAALQKKVLAYLDQESKNIAAFDAARTQPGTPWLPFQISTHKLGYILPRIRTVFAAPEGDNTVSNYLAGKFVHDASFADRYPILKTNTFFGSNAATIQAATMFSVLFATTDASMAQYAPTDSSIAHAVPCADLPASFVTSGSKFCITLAGVPAFAVPHGGYAFGGQRGQTNQKTFGFEDCSSMVANVLYQSRNATAEYVPAPTQTSTMHQLFAWRARQNNPALFIDRNSEQYDNNIAAYWNNIAEPETPNASNIQAGDVYVLRTFAKAKGDPNTHAAGGGHTGIVIDRDPADPARVLIFECNRDMEQENPAKGIWGVAGAGVGSVVSKYNEETDDRYRHTMFLRPKATY